MADRRGLGFGPSAAVTGTVGEARFYGHDAIGAVQTAVSVGRAVP